MVPKAGSKLNTNKFLIYDIGHGICIGYKVLLSLN